MIEHAVQGWGCLGQCHGSAIQRLSSGLLRPCPSPSMPLCLPTHPFASLLRLVPTAGRSL